MAKSIERVQEASVLASERFHEFGKGLAVGAGLAAVFSLESAFDKLKETISQYDEISKDAKTAGLKADTYQALAFAAKQANIDQESFNSSLDIFAKNAGLAVHGTGALYAGLKNLNPQLLQSILNTKDQEERLKLVADAMAQTSDATQKAALSTIVFGKGGVEMTRILDQGRASIDKFKKTAKDLGIVIPDDLLEKAGEISDKLIVLAKVINVQLGEALINAAPLLVDAAGGFAKFAAEINGLSKAITDFTTSPSVDKFRELLSKITGDTIIKGSFADDLINGLNISTADVGALTSGIDFLEKKLAELKDQAAQGADVHVEIEEATASLNELKSKLMEVQGVGEGAAKAISAGFAQAFREAENASMEALAAMGGTGALPTVHRYGGDPNKITLPAQRFNFQQDVNSSGVNVTKFGADPNAKATADHTQQTADNINTLDTNTKGYIESLSRDMGQYSAQQIQAQNISISKLSDLTAETFGMLPQALVAALAVKNDSGTPGTSGGGYMFGDAFDSRYGSYISSRGIQTRRPIGSYKNSDNGLVYGSGKSQPQILGNITVGDINVNGVTDGAQAGRQAAYEFIRTVYGAMSGEIG